MIELNVQSPQTSASFAVLETKRKNHGSSISPPLSHQSVQHPFQAPPFNHLQLAQSHFDDVLFGAQPKARQQFTESEARSVIQFLYGHHEDVIDHEAPRSLKVRVPGLAEGIFNTVAGVMVGPDFLAQRASRKREQKRWMVENPSLAQNPALLKNATFVEAQRIQDVMNFIRKLDQFPEVKLSVYEDKETGEPISPEEVKVRLVLALTKFPKLWYVAKNAIDMDKPRGVARPDLQTLIEKLAEVEVVKIEDDEQRSRSHLTHVNSDDAMVGHAKEFLLKLPKSEADEMAAEIQASGLWTAKMGKRIGAALRNKPVFQQGDLSQEEAVSRLVAGKDLPVTLPIKMMAIREGLSQVTSEQREPGLKARLKEAVLRQNITTPIVDDKLPFTVISKDPNAEMLLLALTHGREDVPPIQPGTVVFVKVRDSKEFTHKVLEPLVGTFRLTQEIKFKDGTSSTIKESCLWPFLEAVLVDGRAGLGDNCFVMDEHHQPTTQHCFDLLANSDIYQFESNDPAMAAYLNHRLHDQTDPKMQDLKGRLAAIQAASLHYAEQVDFGETVGAFIKGATVGVVGEESAQILEGGHHGEHGVSPAAFALRIGYLAIVDAIDNWFGEQGALEADLIGMGLENTDKDIYGDPDKWTAEQKKRYENHWAHKPSKLPPQLQALRKSLFLMATGDAPGPAAQSVATAYRAAIGGALGGMVLSIPVATVLSSPLSTVAERMGATALATLGTALAIPINYSLTLPRVMAVANEHYRSGRLKFPDAIAEMPTDTEEHRKAREAEIKKFINHTARQEMLSRVGLQASIKAYSVVPAMGLLWLPELFAPGSRAVMQSIIGPSIPAAENLTRAVIASERLYRSFKRDMDRVEGVVLRSTMDPDTEENHREELYRRDIRNAFADTWANTANLISEGFSHGLEAGMTGANYVKAGVRAAAGKGYQPGSTTLQKIDYSQYPQHNGQHYSDDTDA